MRGCGLRPHHQPTHPWCLLPSSRLPCDSGGHRLCSLAIPMGSWSPGLGGWSCADGSGPVVGTLLPVSPGAGPPAPTCLRKHWCLCSGHSIQGGRHDPSHGPPLALGRPRLSVCPCVKGGWGHGGMRDQRGGPGWAYLMWVIWELPPSLPVSANVSPPPGGLPGSILFVTCPSA